MVLKDRLGCPLACAAALATIARTPARTPLGLYAKAGVVEFMRKDCDDGIVTEPAQMAVIVSLANDVQRIARVLYKQEWQEKRKAAREPGEAVAS